jgi:hypothetical protein
MKRLIDDLPDIFITGMFAIVIVPCLIILSPVILSSLLIGVILYMFGIVIKDEES